MNDHYVEVETTKGTTLILLRFSDALEELGCAYGLQVRRSIGSRRTLLKAPGGTEAAFI